jgi:hypothetical protein
MWRFSHGACQGGVARAADRQDGAKRHFAYRCVFTTPMSLTGEDLNLEMLFLVKASDSVGEWDVSSKSFSFYFETKPPPRRIVNMLLN